MAELLNDDHFAVRLPLRRIRRIDGGKGEHYPFDAWADGRTRLAFRGKDYVNISPGSFRATLARWAKDWGVECVAITLSDDKVQFTLGPLSPEAKERRDYNYGPILYDLEKERGY